MLKLRLAAGLCLFSIGVFFAGCSKEPSSSTPAAPKAEDQKAAANVPAETPPAANTGAEEMPEGLKELEGEDLAIAKKQRICPVTRELLGSMGEPYKIMHKDQTVFLCCEGCEEDFKKEPEKYLARLKEGK